LQIADLIEDLIRERGPLTVAAFMELALYDPRCGYYARAAQRSGRAGDFFTSVDVGPVFGELLEIQIAEMAAILAGLKTRAAAPAVVGQDFSPAFDLVEAGAGNGRLSADILRAMRRRDPLFYDRIRLHLVEASASARAEHGVTMGEEAERLVASSGSLPSAFEGVLIANELLDALPIHQVIMREGGLREVYVDIAGGRLVLREGPVSTPALNDYLAALGIALEPGWRAEINLGALAWIREVARRLRRGFVILIDYGHAARELYSPTHASGTLTTFARHTMAGPESPAGTPPWLVNPGEQDITAHVDFTSVRAAAEGEGLTTVGFLDQTYFLLGLLGSNASNPLNPLNHLNPLNPLNLKVRLALKTLVMPGGLGSTHKVLILGKGVGAPPLQGCSYRMRVT
jgi:SAM-dependent MidA family methyltransferase